MCEMRASHAQCVRVESPDWIPLLLAKSLARVALSG